MIKYNFSYISINIALAILVYNQQANAYINITLVILVLI
jgi:hypothetical protein